MLNVDEALNLIAQHIAVLGSEDETLEKVLGRVAARDYFMPSAVPAWDSSARDGFALRSSDIEAAGIDSRPPRTGVGDRSVDVDSPLKQANRCGACAA